MQGLTASDLTAPTGIVIPNSCLKWEFTRSGGPGGQHANTSASRATLVIDLDHAVGPPDAVEALRAALGARLRISVADSRSQWQNRRRCLEIAVERITEASSSAAPRLPTRPSRAAVRRRRDAKERTAEKKRSRRAIDEQ